MEGIRGYLQVTEKFHTAGQPSESEFADVHARGVRLVVNLAMPDSDHALADERAVVERLGMRYCGIPVPFSAPTVDHFVLFEAALAREEAAPTLVHCALNWRATSFAALYAERWLGWRGDQAEALRRALWTPNQVWQEWAQAVRLLPRPSSRNG